MRPAAVRARNRTGLIRLGFGVTRVITVTIMMGSAAMIAPVRVTVTSESLGVRFPFKLTAWRLEMAWVMLDAYRPCRETKVSVTVTGRLGQSPVGVNSARRCSLGCNF